MSSSQKKLTVAEFQRLNRAPVWKGKNNRWTLFRTSRDNPNDADIRNTTAAVFGKWFGSSGASSLLDPSLVYEGSTRSGSADLIRVRAWGPATGTNRLPLMAPVPMSELGSTQKLQGASVRRELAPGPLQVIAGPNPIAVQVSFVWRGPEATVPWPVWRSSWFPLPRDWHLDPLAGKDWMLGIVHPPTFGAPEELSTGEKVTASAGDTILQSTNPAANAASQLAEKAGWNIGLPLIAGGLAYVGAKVIGAMKGR